MTPRVRHDLKTYTGSTDVNTTLVFSVSERRRMDTSRNDWLNGIYFIAINTAQRTLLWVRIYYTETFCCISSHHFCRHRSTWPKKNRDEMRMTKHRKCEVIESVYKSESRVVSTNRGLSLSNIRSIISMGIEHKKNNGKTEACLVFTNNRGSS